MIDLGQSGLTKTSIEKIQTVFAQTPAIITVVLYGSRAKGNYHQGSDIDLCIQKTTSQTFSINQLEVELDDLLLPYGIDLSIFSHIENPQLIEHIQRCAIPFYLKLPT